MRNTMAIAGYCWLLLAIPKINTKRQLARNMLAEGLEPTLMAEISGLTEDEVKVLMVVNG